MQMNYIIGSDPKSMKERFCFDPSKIPSGFVKEDALLEWEYYNNGTGW